MSAIENVVSVYGFRADSSFYNEIIPSLSFHLLISFLSALPAAILKTRNQAIKFNNLGQPIRLPFFFFVRAV